LSDQLEQAAAVASGRHGADFLAELSLSGVRRDPASTIG
jgi:hypothetical protein